MSRLSRSWCMLSSSSSRLRVRFCMGVPFVYLAGLGST
jgi:hypothetical protein